MAKIENGLIDQIWDPACRVKKDNLWAFNMKVDGVIYGRCLDSKENTYEAHDSLRSGDRVSFEYEEKGKYKNFKKIDIVGSLKEETDEKIPEGITNEEYLQKNWDMSFRIAKNAIDEAFTSEFIQGLNDMNPGAYIEAVEKTAVSVSIDMKQRGF